MDPISRESSPSYLPIAGLIAGLLGLLVGGIALVNAAKANKAVAAAEAAQTELTNRINGFEGSISAAQSTADSAKAASTKLVGEVNSAFQQVAGEMAKINGELTKLQEAASKPAAKPGAAGAKPGAAGAKSAEPVVAGPGEYVVKAGDTGYKIAQANGVSVDDLKAVNAGVNWNGLKVGQKVKLPKK